MHKRHVWTSDVRSLGYSAADGGIVSRFYSAAEGRGTGDAQCGTGGWNSGIFFFGFFLTIRISCSLVWRNLTLSQHLHCTVPAPPAVFSLGPQSHSLENMHIYITPSGFFAKEK